MTEAIAETVLPGTYIEVRSEGLIGVGGIATGNVGIVGTAARGPTGKVVELDSAATAQDVFGPSDGLLDRAAGAPPPLTLTRGLELAFAGGARKVFAVRIANGTPAAASVAITAANTPAQFVVSAGPPGDRPAGEPDPDAGSWGNALTVQLVKGLADVVTLTVALGNRREAFTGKTLNDMQAALAASRLVHVSTGVDSVAAVGEVAAPKPLAGGTDGPAATALDVAAGLAALEDRAVNIVTVPGFGADAVKGVVGAHVERTENDARERIAVVGVTNPGSPTDVSAPVAEAGGVSDDRMVLVAPGLTVIDRPTGRVAPLGASYLAAVVAGKLATLAPHVSLTNKTVPVDELTVDYKSGTTETLLTNRMLVVRKRFGFQVVRSVTTELGAFKEVSIRRIVDFAKAGVRLGADPYIGKLNNARVRAALKATLDGFLSQMVLDEMLTGYELDVSATRRQEIDGVCVVTMTLQPTFSINVVRVTMNLQ